MIMNCLVECTCDRSSLTCFHLRPLPHQGAHLLNIVLVHVFHCCFLLQTFTLIALYNQMTRYVNTGPVGIRSLAEVLVTFERIEVRPMEFIETYSLLQ